LASSDTPRRAGVATPVVRCRAPPVASALMPPPGGIRLCSPGAPGAASAFAGRTHRLLLGRPSHTMRTRSRIDGDEEPAPGLCLQRARPVHHRLRRTSVDGAAAAPARGGTDDRRAATAAGDPPVPGRGADDGAE